MTTKTITGLYDNYDQAVQTVRDLEAAQITDADISIVAHSSAAHDVPSDSAHGAGTGASAGAAIGSGAGLLAGLGMLVIPGIGPVVAAGWFAATAVGGATGGIIGRLTSAGVTKEHANFYAEAARRGGSLVIVRVDKGLFAIAAEAIMQRHGRIDPATREKAYRDGGWNEFKEKSAPYTSADVARERALHSTRP